MKVCIIGKIRPELSYEEWANRLNRRINGRKISAFNITVGNKRLNNFVRRFAFENNIPVTEFAPDELQSQDSRRNRNRVMIDRSDLLIGFLPE